MVGQLITNSNRVITITKKITSPSHQTSYISTPLIQAPKPTKSRATKPKPKRYKNFNQFSKIPPEIRLKIWRYAIRPRVIRAEYQNVCTELVHNDIRLARYVLDAGPVPPIMRVNSESRSEALRFYSLIKAQLPVHFMARDGERSPPGSEPRKMPTWLDIKIWINPSFDVFFFVNFPSTNEFLSYFRRISRPSIGGLPLDRPIKHIALVGKDVQRFRTSGRTDLFYSLCMEHKQVSTINIVLDNSNFRDDAKPETYSLWKVNSLPAHSYRGGGLHGGRELRENCVDIFQGFWEGKATVKECQRWKAWREKNRDWTPPKVMFKRIAKIKKAPPVKKPRVRKPMAKKVVVVIEIDDDSEEESEEESDG
ncbi:hypothetical protein WAI453_009678 [Rhynchosporium graminicola]|uniref:2EXR domain-containing protein n=1 Tax=Rhynchosporium graminicola TaxID=2792576 RepID=A0A1E1L181_9HELO|nr:uncharacterized protein RCO7_10672 [Rhynchosporium commune]